MAINNRYVEKGDRVQVRLNPHSKDLREHATEPGIVTSVPDAYGGVAVRLQKGVSVYGYNIADFQHFDPNLRKPKPPAPIDYRWSSGWRHFEIFDEEMWKEMERGR